MKCFPFNRIFVLVLLACVAGFAIYLIYLQALESYIALSFVALSFALVVINIWDVRQDNIAMAENKIVQAIELMDKGHHLAAKECLDTAISYDRDNFNAIVARGELHRLEQSYEDARRELLKANEICPNSSRVHFSLGLIYLQEKKILEAISEFKQTIKLKPDFCESYFILAQAYELSGEKNNALIAYRKFTEVVTSEDLVNSKIAGYLDRATEKIRLFS